eukprot:gene2439-8763_t
MEAFPGQWKDNPKNRERWRQQQFNDSVLRQIRSQGKGLNCHFCKKGPLKLYHWSEICDHPLDIATVNHVVPLSQGGTNTRDNMVVSCRSCSSKVCPGLSPHARAHGLSPQTRVPYVPGIQAAWPGSQLLILLSSRGEGAGQPRQVCWSVAQACWRDLGALVDVVAFAYVVLWEGMDRRASAATGSWAKI